ncbi:MAG: site-specific DNA-methyltransferase [Gammaproteobacteria bacterium]|nr:site-specific DNA-methyltransferase [Gammaproteobacteria bacterium]
MTEYRKISELIPYARNSRTHSAAQVSQIAGSIDEFGFAARVVVRDGVIAKGHGTVQACQQLMDAGKTIYHPPKQGGERVPLPDGELPILDASGWAESRFRAFVIADNQLAITAGWDEDLLAVELGDLEADGFDMDLLGFGEGLGDLLGVNNKKPPEDVEPVEPPADPKSKRGDAWLMGDHRLMCGDSTDEGDVGRLMGGDVADLFLTDPPYGVSYASKNEFLNNQDEGNRVQTEIENDHCSPGELREFCEKAFMVAHRFTKQKMGYYVCAPQGGEQMMMMMALDTVGFSVKHELIWVKNNHVLGRADYNYKHEPIIYGWKKKGTHKFYASDHQTSIFEFDKPISSKLHPTMKPVELFEKIVRNGSGDGMAVLDLFSGSGTTIIACEQTGRKCYAMEISPAYVDVAVDRWERVTGKTATLEARE